MSVTSTLSMVMPVKIAIDDFRISEKAVLDSTVVELNAVKYCLPR
jgi:hypothetical protein